MKNLLEYSKQYNKFGFNVIPLKGKKPAIRGWEYLKRSKQSTAEIENLNWTNKVNGIGGINNSIASLDFDKCEDEIFVLNFAKELGINSWIVKTGFGYHIHLRIKDIDNIDNKFGAKSVHTFYPKDKSKLSQCELRIRDCYTALPPSKHSNGSIYKFISGKPQNSPEKVTFEKLFEVLLSHFTLRIDKKEVQELTDKNDFSNAIKFGVMEGQRHKILIRYFGLLLNREFSFDLILNFIRDWNNKNIPPIEDKEIERQVKSLWWNYSEGLNGIFHQFENILLSLDYDMEIKLKMILCYSVIEYNSDGEILSKLSLETTKNQYHKECKDLIEKNNKRTGKRDQIIRVGEDLIIDVIKRKVKYDYFSVYAGIISFLGRKQQAKRISNEIIAYRAIGYKNFNDWYESESTQSPPSRYKIIKAVEYLEAAGFLRTFSLKKGQMKYYSTRLKTKEELAVLAKNYERKKLRGKIEEEKLRKNIYDEINGLEKEYKQLKENNADNESCIIDCNMYK